MGQKTSTPHTHMHTCTHTRPILIGKLPILFGGYFYFSFCFSRKKNVCGISRFSFEFNEEFFLLLLLFENQRLPFYLPISDFKAASAIQNERNIHKWVRQKENGNFSSLHRQIIKKLLTNTHCLCVSINIDRARNWSFSSWMRFLLLFLKIRRNGERMYTFNRWPIKSLNGLH